jgi:hypothetical protein
MTKVVAESAFTGTRINIAASAQKAVSGKDIRRIRRCFERTLPIGGSLLLKRRGARLGRDRENPIKKL